MKIKQFLNTMMVSSGFNDGGKGKESIFVSAEPDKQLPWVEKYRPVALDSVLSQPDIINTSTPMLLSRDT